MKKITKKQIRNQEVVWKNAIRTYFPFQKGFVLQERERDAKYSTGMEKKKGRGRLDWHNMREGDVVVTELMFVNEKKENTIYIFYITPSLWLCL